MFSPELAYIQLILHVTRGRIESVRNDRGASTLELAIISALLVVAAAAIAGAIVGVINRKQEVINLY